MLADSGLLRDLEAYAFSPAGLPMCIYGDPAYPLRVHLQGPFRNPHLTPLMEAFNASMSSVTISVEWLFGDIINYFKFLDFKKNLKIGMSSIGKMYIVCALNCTMPALVSMAIRPHHFSSLNPPPSRNTLLRGREK